FAVEAARKDLERQRMEEAMRASEHLRATILSTISDGIFYMQVEEGLRYRFLSTNRAYTQIVGATEDEVKGRLLNDVLPEAMRDPVLAQYRRAVETQADVAWEQIIETRSGPKHAEITIAPIIDASSRCTNIVGMIHDISVRVQAEAERARFVAQLNQSHR